MRLIYPKQRPEAGLGGVYFYQPTMTTPQNEAMLNVSQIIKTVMLSAAEAKLGALFINTKLAVPMQNMLEKLGHPQPPTPMQTDNPIARGTHTPKATKAMDMQFWWLQYQDKQDQCWSHWRPGTLNWTAY